MQAVNAKKKFKKPSFYRFKRFLEKNWGQIFIVIALLILAVLVLFPLLVMVMRSFKFADDDLANPFGIPDKITLENYIIIWEYIKSSYLNSFITAIGVTVGTVVVTALLSYAFIKFDFPGKQIIYYLVISLMMIPSILTLISRYQMVNSMGMLNSLWGIIIPGVAGYIPMAFMLLFTFFNGIPKELFEAADMDNANDFIVFLKIVIPLSKPILFTIAIQTFVGEWNDYLWAKLILTDESRTTLPVILNSLSEYFGSSIGYCVPFAGYVLSALPLIILFIIASKQFIAGMTSGAFKM